MTVSVDNLKRLRALRLSRSFKDLFLRAFVPKGWFWRWLFTDETGTTTRIVGEHVLADLRDYCLVTRTTFSTDPLVSARMQGRREVALRIINFLNLDEETVRKLMEIDNGL